MGILRYEDIVAKYEGANAIYALQRKKKLSGKEKAFDWAVALLSPLPGIVEEADKVADMGSYFLVETNGEQTLVRVSGEETAEEVVTGKITKKSDKVFIYEDCQYAFFKELISGKALFTLNI